MGKKGGNEGWLIVGSVLAFGALLYLQSGRGKNNNSPYIPDRIEDAIDAVVEAFNQQFGHDWVNRRLDLLQSYIQKAMPQVAAFGKRGALGRANLRASPEQWHHKEVRHDPEIVVTYNMSH